jgi:RES domain-containing protein
MDPRIHANLAVDPADLACAWDDLALRRTEPPSWALARRLTAAGTAAIIVPSFAPWATDDPDIVLWRWSEALPHRVAVIDDEGRLPKDQRSWS